MLLVSTQVCESLLCIHRSWHKVVWLDSGSYALLLRSLPGTQSQNSSEKCLTTALAVGGIAWLLGQRNSFAILFPFSLIVDTESCVLVIGLKEAYPEQMGDSLWAQMEKELWEQWQSPHMEVSKRERDKCQRYRHWNKPTFTWSLPKMSSSSRSPDKAV